jgi:hypothetical protein
MKEKSFEFGAGRVTAKELTVGQMRKVKAMLKEDDLEASLLMVKLSTSKSDGFIDNLTMSEVNLIGDWLANPTN